MFEQCMFGTGKIDLNDFFHLPNLVALSSCKFNSHKLKMTLVVNLNIDKFHASEKICMFTGVHTP